jgi:hypothetical protein
MIEDEKYYAVKELSAGSGFSVDSINRRIEAKLLKAFVLPKVSKTRKRTYKPRRVLGRDWRRFLENNTF